MSILKKTLAVAAAASLVCLYSVGAMAANESKLTVRDSSGTNDVFTVTNTGRIGISNNNTGNQNLVTDAAIYVKGSTYPDTTIKVEGVGGGGFIAYTPYTPTSYPTAGTRLGYQYFGAVNSSVSPPTVLHATGFFAGADATWTATSTPAYFTFETTPAGSTTRLERMRITSTGNIGIGTTAPTQKLVVRDGGIRLDNNATQPTCDNANAANVRGLIWFVKGSTGVADSLQICARDGSGTYSWKTANLQ